MTEVDRKWSTPRRAGDPVGGNSMVDPYKPLLVAKWSGR